MINIHKPAGSGTSGSSIDDQNVSTSTVYSSSKTVNLLNTKANSSSLGLKADKAYVDETLDNKLSIPSFSALKIDINTKVNDLPNKLVYIDPYGSFALTGIYIESYSNSSKFPYLPIATTGPDDSFIYQDYSDNSTSDVKYTIPAENILYEGKIQSVSSYTPFVVGQEVYIDLITPGLATADTSEMNSKNYPIIKIGNAVSSDSIQVNLSNYDPRFDSFIYSRNNEFGRIGDSTPYFIDPMAEYEPVSYRKIQTMPAGFDASNYDNFGEIDNSVSLTDRNRICTVKLINNQKSVQYLSNTDPDINTPVFMTGTMDNRQFYFISSEQQIVPGNIYKVTINYEESFSISGSLCGLPAYLSTNGRVIPVRPSSGNVIIIGRFISNFEVLFF